MFIKTIPEKATGRILMNLCSSTHVRGRQVQKTVRRIGYIDEFADRYPDPLAHFKEEAKRLTEEQKAAKVTLEYSLGEHFDFPVDNSESVYDKRGIFIL